MSAFVVGWTVKFVFVFLGAYSQHLQRQNFPYAIAQKEAMQREWLLGGQSRSQSTNH